MQPSIDHPAHQKYEGEQMECTIRLRSDSEDYQRECEFR